MPEFDPDREDASMQAAIGVRWSPFRGGRIAAEVDRARADRRRADAERRAAELEAERESIEAWAEREAARRRLEASGLQREAAEEAYRIVSLRFAEGRDTLARLLEAERALTDARTQEVRARAAVQVAEARLRWAAVGPLVR
jgi:outer membrane protein TolC